MLSTIYQIAAVILVFGGLIFFHELGHFLVARFFSMGVQTFSLGFGPILWSKTKGKTKYQVALLPLGGYVALAGENKEDEIPEGFTKEDLFASRPAWQRICVIAAGPIFNLVLAWILCWVVIFSYGSYSLSTKIESLVPDGPAMQAGLLAGDKILSLDDEKIQHWEEIPIFLQINQGKAISVTVDRAGEGTKQFSVQPVEELVESGGQRLPIWRMGLGSGSPTHKEYSFFGAAKEGYKKAEGMLSFTWKALSGLITQKIPASSMGGPIGIVQVIYQQADKHVADLLLLAALISINLGALNLLPVPVLDGGHIFFLLIELLTGKKVPAVVQEKATIVGLFLLLSLMVFSTFNDLSRLFF